MSPFRIVETQPGFYSLEILRGEDPGWETLESDQGEDGKSRLEDSLELLEILRATLLNETLRS